MHVSREHDAVEAPQAPIDLAAYLALTGPTNARKCVGSGSAADSNIRFDRRRLEQYVIAESGQRRIGTLKRNILLLTLALLCTPSVGAASSQRTEARAAFREAVERYQAFVIPHCAPEDVKAYVSARAERDRLFIQSLRNTKLLGDYKMAIAHRAKQDANTRYECMQPVPSLPQEELVDPRTRHFVEGDRQFAVMLRLRNAALGS
jgi:hypothetical protein